VVEEEVHHGIVDVVVVDVAAAVAVVVVVVVRTDMLPMHDMHDDDVEEPRRVVVVDT
jgi:hypothetical protein